MRNVVVKKRGWYALVLSLLLLNNGCRKSWLDAKTDKNLAVPSTLNDFQTLMDNTDVMNESSCAIGEIGSDGHLVVKNWTLESDLEHNAYTWTHSRPVINSNDWNAPYKRVAYCNQILEGLNGLTPGNASDQQWWNALKGEALFQRSRTFIELAQVYAPALTLSLPGNWGIPMRLNTNIHEPSVRPTVRENYNQAIGDLLIAANLLPQTPAYKTRASKPAVLAELARAYLAIEKYDSALIYSDSCLKGYNSLLNYNGLDTTGYAVPPLNNEIIFYSSLVKWGNIGADAGVDPALYALYDTTDLRRAVFFDTDTNSVRFMGSYCNSLLLFSGLAVDELYLIRAECYARMGGTVNIANAMHDVNSLLRQRYRNGHFTELAAGDAKQALLIVLQERRKELLLRGLRWTDLRRLSNDSVYRQPITRVVDNNTYTLMPGSFQYTFPIPDDVIQMTGIAQNPGWQ